MAKTTATIFGLALAAGAIGLNATRYPIVFHTTKATTAKTSDTTDPPAEPPENPLPPQPEAAPPPAPPHFDETPPMVVEETPAEQETPEIAPMETPPSTPPVIEEPLAPVSFVGLSRGTDEPSNAKNGIRRLPPVDPYSTVAPDIQGNAGTIPIYPTTGID